MEEIKIISKTEQDTKEIGQKLAKKAKRGDIRNGQKRYGAFFCSRAMRR